MKDIKSVLIGFLLASCMFFLMGATQEMFVTSSDNGRYQIANDGTTLGTLFMLDTKTGELYKKPQLSRKKDWKKISGSDWSK